MAFKRSGRWAVLWAALMLAIPASLPASAMSFDLAPLQLPSCQPDCPLVIVASGEIELNSDDVFYEFVRTKVMPQRVASTVVISSPGGNLVGSLKLGHLMRELGFSLLVGRVSGEALVTARCFSACAYALAGGRRRIVPPGSEVGVHRAWTKVEDDPSGSLTRQYPPGHHAPILSRYLRAMGVSDRLVALADSTSSDDIRILTRAELTRLRLATGEGRTARRERSR